MALSLSVSLCRGRRPQKSLSGGAGEPRTDRRVTCAAVRHSMLHSRGAPQLLCGPPQLAPSSDASSDARPHDDEMPRGRSNYVYARRALAAPELLVGPSCM